jgi:putative Holliday junction resolvase
MRSVGLDVGDNRTGVAISDPQGTSAMPLTVLASEEEDLLIGQILEVVERYEAQCIVVGLPRHLNGQLGEQARKVTAFADRLALRAKQTNLNQLEIRLWDERFSTRAAERLKRDGAGKGNRLRSKRKTGARNRSLQDKGRTDSIAAALILQGYLDSLTPITEGQDR